MRRRITVAVSVFALVLAVLPATGAAAQPGPGWLYVSLGGEIVAMRPDGSDQRNLTGTSDRYEDMPDVSTSGRDIIAQYQEITDEGQVSRQGGLHYINPVTPGGDFDPLSQSFVAGTYAPSWGLDASNIYHSNGQNQIDALLFFEGRVITPVANNGGANGYRDPDGSPLDNETVLYTFTNGIASNVVGGLRLRNFGDSPADLLVAAGSYESAGLGRFFPDGSKVIFTCTVGNAAQLCTSSPVQDSTDFATIPTPQSAFNAVVSPDQTQIAYRGLDGSVWVAELSGANATQIVGPTDVDPQNFLGFGLDWGQEIPLRGGPPPEEPPPPTDPAPNTPLPPGGGDGDPTTTERAMFSRPGPFAAAVSGARFNDAGNAVTRRGGLATAEYAVLGRDDAFADSLAGSPLTRNGPLLFTPSDELDEGTAAELQRVLEPGGTVYLLGGTVALDDGVEQAVTDLGLVPRRLAGPSRFETAAIVAREVVELGGSDEEVIVARGVGPEDNPTAAWADSVTGGAHAAAEFVPVLVTQTDAVHPAVQAYVSDVGATATLLGGTAALTDEVQEALDGSRRIAGLSRADTAAQIATVLIGLQADQPRDVLLFDGFAEDGWTFGLAGAGLAADRGAALLVSGPDFLPPETEVLLSTCGEPEVETLILGWEGVIPASVADRIDELDGQACR